MNTATCGGGEITAMKIYKPYSLVDKSHQVGYRHLGKSRDEPPEDCQDTSKVMNNAPHARMMLSIAKGRPNTNSRQCLQWHGNRGKRFQCGQSCRHHSKWLLAMVYLSTVGPIDKSPEANSITTDKAAKIAARAPNSFPRPMQAE